MDDSSSFKVGLLATRDSPLLPYFIESIMVRGIQNLVVIYDSQEFSLKNRNLWLERTGGVLDSDDERIARLYRSNHFNIPFYEVANHNDNSCTQLVKELGIDCLVNAGTPRRLTSVILKSTKHGILNIHPGLLPDYRGCSAVEWAIYNDDPIGVTAHFMDGSYDTGPIVDSKVCVIEKHIKDYKLIRRIVYRDMCQMAGRAIQLVRNNGIVPEQAKKQEEGAGKYWNPIPEEAMQNVLDKISSGSYPLTTLAEPW